MYRPLLPFYVKTGSQVCHKPGIINTFQFIVNNTKSINIDSNWKMRRKSKIESQETQEWIIVIIIIMGLFLLSIKETSRPERQFNVTLKQTERKFKNQEEKVVQRKNNLSKAQKMLEEKVQLNKGNLENDTKYLEIKQKQITQLRSYLEVAKQQLQEMGQHYLKKIAVFESLLEQISLFRNLLDEIKKKLQSQMQQGEGAQECVRNQAELEDKRHVLELSQPIA